VAVSVPTVKPRPARPLLAVGVAFAGGALVGQAATILAPLLLALATACLVSALAATRLSRIAVMAAAFAGGAGAAGIERAAHEQTPLRMWVAKAEAGETPVLVTGVAAADALDAQGRRSVVLDVETLTIGGTEQRMAGRARIEVAGMAPPEGAPRFEIADGDRLAVWTALRPPRGFGNPGSFDVAAHARRQGIHALGYCKSARLGRVLGPADVGWLRAAASRVRRWARGAFEAYMLPGPEQGLARAMVLGDRTGVDAETADAFRVAGTYHILAISGAQVALLAGILAVLLARVQAGPSVSAVAIPLSLAFYAQLVGGDAPVVRAAVMAGVLVVGRALDLDADLANLLGLAALALLVHRPSAIADVGFQLSFGATLGILLLTPVLVERLPTLPLRLELALAASLAAQAAITPLLVLHFNRLAPAALILNLVAVPLSAAVLLTGALVLVAALLLPVLAPWMGDVAWIAAHALLVSGEPGRWPPLDVRAPAPGALAVAVHLAGLILLQGRRVVAGLTLVLAGAAAFVVGPGAVADGRMALTVLDVGQGDCLVLRSPRGRSWLVDAGGGFDSRFDPGEAVVGPYLWSQGMRRLEGVVVTHAHPDHVGGVPFLLRGFGIGEVWEGVAPRHDRGYHKLNAALKEAAVRRRTVRRGVVTTWDGVVIRVVWPEPSGGPPWSTRNDDSVVLDVSYGDVHFLLAGDIEDGAESRLPPARAQVLKVPHHGSKSSTSPGFIAAVGPRLAIVSAGYKNRFGHPHPTVVERLHRAGVRLYRTDRDGAVTVSTDGSAIWVRTFREGLSEQIR
jgi:competence protein ComEC